MPPVIHSITAAILVLAHAVFLFRGLSMRRWGGRPARIDKIARFISQFGLPAVILLGFLSQAAPSAIHIILGILPIIVIIAFTPFMAFKRRIPWLLPAINLFLLTSAAVTGMLQL